MVRGMDVAGNVPAATRTLTVLRALASTLKPQDTLVLVTHKPELLALVDRIIVVANHQIALDGPKAQVLQQLHNAAAQQANAQGGQPSPAMQSSPAGSGT